MPIQLAAISYIIVLIVAANLEEQRRLGFPLLALMTLGIDRLDRFWRLFTTALSALSFTGTTRFDASKPVQRSAALLLMLGIFVSIMRSPPQNEASYGISELLLSGALYLLLAFLGVGWRLRRRTWVALWRLGLRLPSGRGAAAGSLAAALLWLFMTAAMTAWAHAAPKEIFLQQTAASRLLFDAFSGSAAAALLLALVSAFSEEILFRGALQPVFGIGLTSFFFALMHQPYVWTPAMLILFAVSLGFGWLRQRYCTSAAIIAHAGYNLLPFLVAG